MRILYLTHGWTTHDRRFLAAATAGGHACWLLRLEDHGAALPETALPPGVREAVWPPRAAAAWGAPEALLPGLGAVLQQLRPDLLHAGPVPTCGYLAARTGFRPLLLMSWGSDILLDAAVDPVAREQARTALDAAGLFLCDCREVAALAAELSPGLDARTVVFPWGTDLHRFTPPQGPSALRRKLGWEDRTVVLSTRSWEPVYDVEVAVGAFAAAHARRPELRLVLAGDGSRAAAVQNLVESGGLAGMVHLPGRIAQSAVKEYYQAADIYLSCARVDGTSVSLLEALATGLPAVVTDRAANREWITPGMHGWLCRAGHPAAFAEALLEAAALDPPERAAMAARNRAVAEARADWKRHSLALLKSYERVHNAYAHCL